MSTYSSNLRIELITNGTQAGTWGDTTNGNLAYVLDSAIAGYQTVSVISSSQALTYTSGPTSTAANNQAIYAMLRFTTTTGGAFNVYAPPNSKAYIVWNNSGYSMTIYNSTVIGNTTAAGTGVTIADGKKVMVFSDATNFYTIDAGNLTGTLAIANGGTGQTTANAALNALLPSQTGNPNKYLQTNGTDTSWDAINLGTSDISGTLAVANGGTGATDATTARSNLGLVIGTNVPSPTGTGASGTWGISVSGSAASATNATYATSAGSATNASSATNATYATSAGSATNATSASSATNATYATSAGSATNATFASSATNATYATSAGSAAIRSATAQSSTSGTAIDFTSIPSGVLRVTVMFNGVSTNGSANLRIQIGSGSFQATGYNSTAAVINGSTPGTASDTAGFSMAGASSSGSTTSGAVVLTSLGSNVWVASGSFKNGNSSVTYVGGDVTLSGTLDRVRVTTNNGTDAFDAGSINILYE